MKKHDILFVQIINSTEETTKKKSHQISQCQKKLLTHN
jgi:hypothetical protein